MKSIYQQNGHLVGISDKYIYLEEIYRQTPRSSQLAWSRYITLTKPISRRNKKDDYKHDKKKKISYYRSFNLCYAPEHYLIRQGYDEVTDLERLNYLAACQSNKSLESIGEI